MATLYFEGLKNLKKALIIEVQAFINTVRLLIGPKASAGVSFVDLTQKNQISKYLI